jgi:hypothetical protein
MIRFGALQKTPPRPLAKEDEKVYATGELDYRRSDWKFGTVAQSDVADGEQDA